MRSSVMRLLRSPRLLLLGAAFAALGAAGCKKELPVVQGSATDAGPPKRPLDHLAPGELVEGDVKAFGLALPKAMHLERAFDDVAFAEGPPLPSAVAAYVEARVREGTVKDTSEGTVFDKVRVPDEPRVLRILVSRSPTGAGTRIQIRDVTPPSKIDSPPDEEARWRAVGLKPNGEPLDRTRLK